MKILTWNVWFGEYEFAARAKSLARELVRRRPEVIALQEVTPILRELLEYALAGYQFHGGDSAFGYDAMIATRVPVDEFRVLELPSNMGRRLLAVELDSGLTVATVHLESTASCERERVVQLEKIGPWLAGRTPSAILVGDMNFDDFAARESDALDEKYVDLWPLLRPTEPGYTIDSGANTMRGDMRKKLKTQKRIDRAFLRSERWKATAIELVGTSPIDDRGTFTSDHFGLSIDLE